MKNTFLILILTNIASSLFAQKITTIKGFAPEYLGKNVEIYENEDLLSLKETLVAITQVKDDSTFSLSFNNSKIQKLIIRSNNNTSYIFVEPGKSYDLFLPLHDRDKPYRPLGNYVTPIFANLDSSDINFKLLTLNNAIDAFYASNLVYFVKNKQQFLDRLKIFKDSVYKTLEKDTSYYNNSVHYTFADLDLSLYTSDKAQQYIFDAYINKKPILYNNEQYFNIIRKLYSKIFTQLSLEVNNRVYMAILKKSPSLLMKALEEESTLKPQYNVKDGKVTVAYSNDRLRELIMIKGLADIYQNAEYPKTNVVAILDSVSKHAKYVEHKTIAKNVLSRLTEITPGNPAPNFVMTTQNDKTINLASYENSYLYFHVFRPDYETNVQDFELLNQVYQRYSGIVKFVSVYPKGIKMNKKVNQIINAIPWEVVELDDNNAFFKDYKITNYPSYILIDRTGTVVSAPALGPKPNGEHMTIDKIFYDIRRMDEIIKEREKRNR